VKPRAAWFAAGLTVGTSLLGVRGAPCQQADAKTDGDTQDAVCRDSQGAEYSPGAVVKVNGKEMTCVIGPHWVAPAQAAAEVLDVDDANLLADVEAAIQKALSGTSLPTLECDAVLNSDLRPDQLLRVPPGERRLVMFWTPTCGPCKPLLADMAALSSRKPKALSVLGIVQSGEPELEPSGEWQLQRVKQLVAQYKVGFPTCVHSSKELTKRWKAEGVPLTLLLSEKGVERVAMGGKNGQLLVADLARRQ
jgi:thiol-disulfide isomerase/thioredoxin